MVAVSDEASNSLHGARDVIAQVLKSNQVHNLGFRQSFSLIAVKGERLLHEQRKPGGTLATSKAMLNLR
jgi:hypothetical protein